MTEHSYDTKSGLGGVFVQKGNTNNIRYLHTNDKVGIKLQTVSNSDLEHDVLQFQNTIQSKAVVSSPETILGSKINAVYLEAMKREK